MKESLLVIKDVGVQIKTTFCDGRSESRFLDQANIMEIIINEGMTRWQVKYYLAILLSGQARGESAWSGGTVGGGGGGAGGGGAGGGAGGSSSTSSGTKMAAAVTSRQALGEESEQMVVVFQVG